jgi:hypothetical protein
MLALGCGPGAGSGGRDAQPALPDDRSLRLGVLVLRPSAPGGRAPGRVTGRPVRAGRRGRGGADRARGRGAGRPAGRVRGRPC